MYANTSDDSDLMIGAFNRTTENEYKEDEVVVEIEQKANSEELDFAPKKETPKKEDKKEEVIDVEYQEEKNSEVLEGQTSLADEIPY